jgi:predicted acetyltransferase
MWRADSVAGMSFELRPLTPDLVPAFRKAISAAFGFEIDTEDKEGAERFDALFALDRAFPAFDGDLLISTGADYEFEVTVPGGAQIAMAGLTIVTVRPTHTRQGVLTAMMREHFRRAQERGEPLSGLWASEAPIYGRFGYGPAVQHHEVKLDTRHTGRSESERGATVRFIEGDEAERILPQVYAKAQPQRAGMLRRTPSWWKYRQFYDPENERDGATAMRHAVAEQDGESIGYVSYRQKGNWDVVAQGEVRISELVPATDAGYRALWHFVTSIDLFPVVKHWNVAPDDPLPLLLNDGRAVVTTAVADSLWVRLIDVAVALESRTYHRDGAVVIRISDGFCKWNDGTYRLAVQQGKATCTRVADEPDVAMTASTLGALYLGGRDAGALARAGLIAGTPAAVQKVNWMFRTSPEPWCPEIF